MRTTLKRWAFALLLLLPWGAQATIAVGAVGSGTNTSFTTQNTITTTGVTTAVTGSSFEVIVAARQFGTNSIPITVTDNKGNPSYTQIGSTINDGATNSVTLYRFLCTHCTGGSSHTVTATFTTSIASTATSGSTTTLVDTAQTTSTSGQWNGYQFSDGTLQSFAVITTQTITPFTLTFPAFGSPVAAGHPYYLPSALFGCVLLEITGGVASALLDQQQALGAFETAPWSSSAGSGVTLTSPATSELLVTAASSINAGTLTWVETGITGTTTQYSFSNGSALPALVTMVVATRVVTSAGPWKATWTDTVAGTADYNASLDSFIGAAGVVPKPLPAKFLFQ